MAQALNPNVGDGIAIATAATTLALPPPQFGLVPDWTSVPEIELEIWAAGATGLTGAELYSARTHPLVIADDDVEDVTHGSDLFTIVAHGLLTGDGPIYLTNVGGALPAGSAAAIPYFAIKASADTFKLASTLLLAMSGTPINLTGNGTGTHTISDLPGTTKRVHWHSDGLLGPLGDGAITLTAQRAYRERRTHSPRTFAYGIAATLSQAVATSALVFPIREL